MSEEKYSRSRSNLLGKRIGKAVVRLDAYIAREERAFGKLVVDDDDGLGIDNPKLSKLLEDLMCVLEKDKIEKHEAYEYLEKSNRTMKKIIEKLRDEMKLYGKNIREEFSKVDDMSTDRLLKINPNCFSSAERAK